MNKFSLYEASVQEPEVHLELFKQFYREVCQGREARVLREDFCSTYWIAAQWVKDHEENFSLALDLDEKPLKWAQINRFRKLKPEQRERLKVLKQDVRSVTTPRAHMIAACNFSFYIFHQREMLKEYFVKAKKSLEHGKGEKNAGLLILEMAGGPGMIGKLKETRTIRCQGNKVKYTWDQKSFDPIHRRAHYGIHFKWDRGEIKDAFTYDWRIWTIPEVREVLKEAGFKDSVVYWETSHKGEGTGEYAQMNEGDNDFAWISYVIGVV